METRAVHSPALAPLLRRRVTRGGRGVATAPPLSSRPVPRPPLGELVGRPPRRRRGDDGPLLQRLDRLPREARDHAPHPLSPGLRLRGSPWEAAGAARRAGGRVWVVRWRAPGLAAAAPKVCAPFTVSAVRRRRPGREWLSPSVLVAPRSRDPRHGAHLFLCETCMC